MDNSGDNKSILPRSNILTNSGFGNNTREK